MSDGLGRAVALLCLLAGCSTSTGSTEPAGGSDAGAPCFSCPPGWVRSAGGGCGPAVILCAPDGGAAAGACAGVDLRRRPVAGDGGAPFWLLPDGGIGGAWPEPDDPEGPPAADWHPQTGPSRCADGWQRAADGRCDPRLRTDCPAGSEPLPGGRCTETAACPAGEFAAPTAATGRVVRVRPGADDARADGTAERPYGTVERALEAAGAGGEVLLGRGLHRAGLFVRGSVRLRGLCARETTVVGVDGMSALRFAGTQDSTLEGVTVRGPGRGVSAEGGARLGVTGVRIEDVARQGLLAFDANTRVTARDVVVRALRPDAEGVSIGAGATDGATLDAERAVIEGGTVFCARAEGSGSLVGVRDARLVGAATLPARRYSVSVGGAIDGGRFVGERVVIEDAGGAAVMANSVELDPSDADGSVVELRDALVRRAAPALREFAFYATGRASLTLERVHVRELGDRQATLSVYPEAVMRVVETTIAHGDGPSTAESVIGVVRGGALTVERTRFDGDWQAGVLVGAGGSLVLRQSEVAARPGRMQVVISTQRGGGTVTVDGARFGGYRGSGLLVQDAEGEASATVERAVFAPGTDAPSRLTFAVAVGAGGEVSLRRSRVEPTWGTALFAQGAGARLALEDVVAAATRRVGAPSATAWASTSAAVTVTRSVVAGEHWGLVANEGSELTVLDSCVRGVRSEDPGRGMGIFVAGGSRAVLRRSAVVGSEAMGIAAAQGSRMEGEDVIVREVSGVVSGAGPTAGTAFGFGVSLTGRASLTAGRLAIVDVGGAAISLGAQDELDGSVLGEASLDVEAVFIRNVRPTAFLSEHGTFSTPRRNAIYLGLTSTARVEMLTVEQAGAAVASLSRALELGAVSVLGGDACGLQAALGFSPVRAGPVCGGVATCVDTIEDYRVPTVNVPMLRTPQ